MRGNYMAKPSSTVERKSIGLRVDVDLIRELRVLAAQNDMQLNLMLEEAIRDLLKKYKKK
jgi:predicted transcriptional regulator